MIILLALFAVQSRGTERSAAMFGPTCASGRGDRGRSRARKSCGIPKFARLNPFTPVSFMSIRQIGFVTRGAVVWPLPERRRCMPDLGHFGKRPTPDRWLYHLSSPFNALLVLP